ncbi:phosphoinositide 5-phosphatase [Malassezia caprae]|uniref:phosphoinositide 5-phosphatase n=1 Tax=Malassezia caprae TaxID=1381934 RepID=A0AAF0IXE9_9BASI|nr:phosphoinositide 5-phosphatase [Malassezia caprae]
MLGARESKEAMLTPSMHVWVTRAATQPPQVLVTRYDPSRAVQEDGSALVLSFSFVEEQGPLTLLDARDVTWSSMRRLSIASMPLVGLLGLLRVGSDMFLVAVSASERVGELHTHAVHRVRNVSFFCLSRRLPNDMALAQGSIEPTDSGRLVPSGPPGVPDDPCVAIRKYLSGGSFYFTSGHDLTRRLSCLNEARAFQEQFVWNTHMREPLDVFRQRLDLPRQRRFDAENLCLSVIQGYVGIRRIPGPMPCQLVVLSRLSTQRAGTRYNMRGIDDDGHAAHFVETETMLQVGDLSYSYVQLRGSVPVFWEQQGLQALSAKIQITRTGAASMPAFRKHMDDLLDEYQRVCALDLLGTRDAEVALSDAYRTHLRELNAADVSYTHYDFHALTKSVGSLEVVAQGLDRQRDVQAQRQAQIYTLRRGQAELERQRGVFRVNCFDCLDRTNLVQGLLSQAVLRDWQQSLCNVPGEPAQAAWARHVLGALGAAHRELWAENGDALSVINTGTGSLNAHFARTGAKKGWTGLLSDAAKSASRMYVNHFQDSSKQEAIDLLLGQRSGQQRIELCDPLYAGVSAALEQRWDDYASVHQERILVGTFNVCAVTPRHDDLRDWLCPPAPKTTAPALVAVCLQEIVPLTAQQMLLTSSEELAAWDAAVLRALHMYGETYVPLRHAQLFGTALLTYARQSLLPHIRCVEGASKKTGFRGMSGNKGGVSVRFDVFDTSVCMVGAHLPAGAGNTEERNSDYASLVRGLTFSRGRLLDEHDYIVWMGDLNYRLEHPSNEEVRELCAAQQYAALAQEDQLTLERRAGTVFRGYDEAPLTFPPTYKYDVGTDLYDTSDKMRPPAWTDRVLFRCTQAHLGVDAHAYGSAQSVRLSDHRPVYALLDVDLCTVDPAAKEAVYEELLRERQGASAPRAAESEPWWLQGPLDPQMGDAVVGDPWADEGGRRRAPQPPPRADLQALPAAAPPTPPRPARTASEPGEAAAPPLPPRRP